MCSFGARSYVTTIDSMLCAEAWITPELFMIRDFILNKSIKDDKCFFSHFSGYNF